MALYTRKRKRTDPFPESEVGIIEDKKDCIRAWGCRLLSKYSECWSDGEWKEERNQILDSYDILGMGPFFCGSGVSETLYNEYIDVWKVLFPSNTSPFLFTQTGTDANNSMYSIFYQHAREIYGKDSIKGNVIFMSNIFGSGRGEYASASHIKPVQKFAHPGLMKNFIVKGPYVKELNPTLPKQTLEQQEAREQEALDHISRLLQDQTLTIASVWIETIIGHTRDVLFLRKEFLLKLRRLCDSFNVVIFCDEILSGIRTGLPFAYQHFAPFEPDYISFGKGLIVSGVAKVERTNAITNKEIEHKIATYTTLQACPARITYSMRLIKWILKQNLLTNIQYVGDYLLQSMKCYDKQTTGIGLMICTSLKTDTLRGVGRRLLPAIDITQSDVDCYILNLQHDDELDRFHMSFCGLCAEKNEMPNLLCISCPQSYHEYCHTEKFPEAPVQKKSGFKCDDCRSNMS